jgi:hypothetical protein
LALKNAFVFLLLTAFAFNIGGPFVILKIQQHQIKQEIERQIKTGIPENELTQITISSENQKDLFWKDRNEFRFRGNMYDVVRVEIVNATTKVYHCIPDGQETKLIAKYFKDLQKRRKDKNNRFNTVKTVKFIEKTNLLPQKLEGAVASKTAKARSVYENHYSPLAPEISSPPPKPYL